MPGLSLRRNLCLITKLIPFVMQQSEIGCSSWRPWRPILNPRSVSQVVMLVAQFMGGVMAFGCSKMSIKQEAVYVTHAALSMMVSNC
ncbi:hypothetical protein DEU50_13538 [Aeromonas salmonicida]|uniref:Uncharacterized protein n=1 Tax=Aeromonas salmonicida TaxID=645 RepID=A0AAX1PD52_AERSA|nr:hypothetical protein DEU50_13538 [Aeromonas salmonicida]